MAITYNATQYNPKNIYVASGGGTSFGSNLSGVAGHDLFTNTYQAQDAIYFGGGGNQIYQQFASLFLNIGTALDAGNTLVWEYYKQTDGWTTIHDLTDGTNGLTTTGSNEVEFPYQAGWITTTINSVNAFWVRCRLTAVIGSPTEGGATQTTAVKCGNGVLAIDGYTSDTPCTLSELKTWVDANAAHIHLENDTPNVYHLKYAVLDVNSATNITGETLMLRPEDVNSVWATTVGFTDNLDYVNGKNFAIIHHASTSASPIYLGSNCVFDGGNILPRAYATVSGTYKNVNFARAEGATIFGVNLGTCTLNGCRIEKVLTGGSSVTFTNTKIIIPTNGQGYFIYNSSITAEGLDYEYETGTEFGLLFLYQPSGTPVFTLNNPLTSLLDIDHDTFRTITRSNTTQTNSYVYFYDTSAETYTTYTTALNNTTANDVPINGDEGDILYIGQTHVYGSYDYQNTYRALAWYFTYTNVSNDYVYAFEWYNNDTSAWESLGTDGVNYWDATRNFTQGTGDYLYARVGDHDATGQTVVNGQTAYWLRIRIVTKGTGTPTLSFCSWKAGVGQNSNWTVWEKYDMEMTVKDSSGTVIEGVSVSVVDSNGDSLGTDTTDSSGRITAIPCPLKKIYWNPLSTNTHNYFGITQDDYGDVTLTLSKSGYITQTHKITMDEKKDLVFTLEAAVKWISPQGKGVYWNTDKTNSQNKFGYVEL